MTKFRYTFICLFVKSNYKCFFLYIIIGKGKMVVVSKQSAGFKYFGSPLPSMQRKSPRLEKLRSLGKAKPAIAFNIESYQILEEKHWSELDCEDDDDETLSPESCCVFNTPTRYLQDELSAEKHSCWSELDCAEDETISPESCFGIRRNLQNEFLGEAIFGSPNQNLMNEFLGEVDATSVPVVSPSTIAGTPIARLSFSP